MSKELLVTLNQLEKKRTTLKRSLDIYYFNKTARNNIFEQIKEVEEQIDKINFKLKIEKEIEKK